MVRVTSALQTPSALLLWGLSALNIFQPISAHVIQTRQNEATGRTRSSLNANWRFERFTTTPDELSYEVLRPWILPSANDFLSAKRYERPSGPAPGSNLSYVQTSFNDGSWEAVTLPHDWAITGTFDAPGVSGGLGKLPINGIGWYRRTLALDAATIESGKSIFLDVDGAMAYSAVWLNGELVGGWPFGYNSFRLDLTPYAKAGNNQLAIRLDNKLESSRWYPGAGLYRNVWLVTVEPVHVAQYGTYITTPTVSAESANVDLVVEVENKGTETQDADVVTEVFEKGSTSGPAVATFVSAKASIAGQSKTSVNGSVTIASPKLWGPPPSQRPNEYVAITTVSVGGSVVDTYETLFGIRSVAYDPGRGIILNGEPVRVQGVCNHHDLGALGAAFNYRAQERQIQILQEMGTNSWRTSHNAPAPELLDLTDKYGMMVMDEIFDTWNQAKVENDFHRIFPEWHEPDVRSWVRRDRNHPSIISWSIGNEIPEQWNAQGAATGKELQDMIHGEDPTRQVTIGKNNANPDTGLAKEIDIIGLNYQGEGRGTSYNSTFPWFRQAFPDKMIWSTESASTVSSRGIYLFPVTPNKTAVVGGEPGAGGDPINSHVSAYDLYSPYWASSPDKVFEQQDRFPYVAGEFVWTGWDYIGEPTPYDNTSRSSYFGVIDLAGFKKDRFYAYQARWAPEVKQAHIFPHWSFGEERVGEVTPIHVFTSGDEAELFVNNASVGRKTRGQYDYRLRWDDVKFEPGSVRVVAYKDGQEWATDVRTTVGAPAGIALTADRDSIAADGQDLSFITAAVVDANGNAVPTATNEITFSVASGTGTVVRTDNGDPTDMMPFPSLKRKAFSGQALAIVRGDTAGQIVIEATADGLDVGSITVTAA
ncbi:Glycoside hydrolase family 2 C-terminal domain 5-containing protein 2 [Elsinoe fawcettii]|nr:Glycoside hydrolase family 2 C-terminal domain 5-containing protein 2 [Elsinoe fawcettii]